MKTTIRFASIAAALLLAAAPGWAGDDKPPKSADAKTAATADKPAAGTTAKAVEAADPDAKAEETGVKDIWNKARTITMQYFKPLDQRGVNVFEAPKAAGVEYTGFKLDWGAAFASAYQGVQHSNTASSVLNSSGVNTNALMPISGGFNNEDANLYLNVQLAPGMRVQLTSYLSSRHHEESWVKDGYILMDQSPIDIKPLNRLMQYVTLKVGHFEINYGDAHFRRTDNGNGIYNPFVGNYIMDAFTTEIGGEVYLRRKDIIAMGSITGGEIHGSVLSPGRRAPAYIGKLGFDKQFNPALRVRLTGSMYQKNKSLSDTLFGGDRGGSPYFYVMENTLATDTSQAWSGTINPGFSYAVTATQVNPFVKYHGFEAFGVVEHITGRSVNETATRTWNQDAFDAVYRFLPREQMYVGLRFNQAQGALANLAPTNLTVRRVQAGGGWFVTPNVLAKLELVHQWYLNFPATDIRNGGAFKGFMMSGVVGF